MKEVRDSNDPMPLAPGEKLMTPEQKFFFDLRGWILLPSVLSAAEIEEMKAEVYAGARHSYQGALQNLLDHPALVGILNEILADERFIFDDLLRLSM